MRSRPAPLAFDTQAALFSLALSRAVFTWIGMYCYYRIDTFAAIRAVELSANMQRRQSSRRLSFHAYQRSLSKAGVAASESSYARSIGAASLDQFAAQFKSESEKAIDAANAELANQPKVSKMGLTLDPREEVDSEQKEPTATTVVQLADAA